MTDPELLLLDEPAAGLDLGGREDLVSTLSVLAMDADSPATVLVSHHVEEIPPGLHPRAAAARRPGGRRRPARPRDHRGEPLGDVRDAAGADARGRALGARAGAPAAAHG